MTAEERMLTVKQTSYPNEIYTRGWGGLPPPPPPPEETINVCMLQPVVRERVQRLQPQACVFQSTHALCVNWGQVTKTV